MYILQQSRVCDSDKSPLVAWLPWASLLTDQWEPPHLQLHHCQHHRHHHHHCRHRHHHHLCRRHRPPPSPTHHHPHPFPHPWLICGNLPLAVLCDPIVNEGSSRYLSVLICYLESVGIDLENFGPKNLNFCLKNLIFKKTSVSKMLVEKVSISALKVLVSNIFRFDDFF